MPQGGLEALNTKEPFDILAYQYDFVCNGYEMASGGVRNHSPEILRRAFEIGFLIYVPFLIIDMVIASVLMSMGMMMLPPSVLSLPFKIIFFVMIDGWYMLSGSLINSFH